MSEYERLERLRIEADRWIACVAGDGSTAGEASRGIRELIDRAARQPSPSAREHPTSSWVRVPFKVSSASGYDVCYVSCPYAPSLTATGLVIKEAALIPASQGLHFDMDARYGNRRVADAEAVELQPDGSTRFIGVPGGYCSSFKADTLGNESAAVQVPAQPDSGAPSEVPHPQPAPAADSARARYVEELIKALRACVKGTEPSGGYEGDDEILNRGIALLRRLTPAEPEARELTRHVDAQNRISALCREIEAIAVSFGYDPYEWLMDGGEFGVDERAELAQLRNRSTDLQQALARAQEERDAWHRVCSDLCDDAECLPGCNSFVHEENCPIGSAAANIQFQIKRAERAEVELARAQEQEMYAKRAMSDAEAELAKVREEQLDYEFLLRMWPLEITRLCHSSHEGPTDSEVHGAVRAARLASAPSAQPGQPGEQSEEGKP